jgi:hypothetical protein
MMNPKFEKTILKDEKGVYWEFHFKVAIDNWDELEQLFVWKHSKRDHPWSHIAISVSETGQTQYPIVTIRLHTGSRKEAISIKDQVIDDLKTNGFHIHDKLQAECSIYDTFPEEDNGWIV